MQGEAEGADGEVTVSCPEFYTWNSLPLDEAAMYDFHDWPREVSAWPRSWKDRLPLVTAPVMLLS